MGRAVGRLRAARWRRRRRAASPRSGGRRPDREGDDHCGAGERDRSRRAGHGGDAVRRARGQGHQELHRHRVPVRLPQGQEVGRDHRRGPRARDPVRRGTDRRRARAVADYQSDLNRAVQVDSRGQDAQRVDHATVGSRRSVREPRRRAAATGGRSRRAAAQRAPGDPGPVAGRLPVSLPSPRRRLHLDDRRPEGGCRRQRGRQALPQCRLGQRARVPAPERRREHGGGRHPGLKDVRLVCNLPRGADVRDRRADLRRRDRRIPTDGGTAAERRADERAGAEVVRR